MLSQAATKDPAMSGQLNYERREADHYPTPPENVGCLLHFTHFRECVVWEPACGEGHISKVLEQHHPKVFSTDLRQTGYGIGGIDFLKCSMTPPRVTAIITNPPFAELAEAFIRKSLELMQPVDGLCAMFLRNEYDCASTGRADLFEGHPAFSKKIVVTKRPRWIEGSTGSPRHNYSWFVWDFKHEGRPNLHYIHPRDAVI